MAPNVTVPMNFGRHLLSSPTHNTLKLNTNKGGVVCASSVILSFNSPVIDHMTTTLHMTSVDMLEFSETAVKVFVDAAYSGIVEGLNRDIFRDVNKIANVFEVSWLAEECAQYFSEIADLMQTASYPELLYLFDEAAFVFEHLKSKEFSKVAIRKIIKSGWKQQFIDKYLENADRLSTKKLDMVIELAGYEASCVVATICTQLSDQFHNQKTFSLPISSRYLLEKSDLHSCKQSDRALFDQLFEVLGKLPESVDNLKWTYQLYRRSDTSSKGRIDKTDRLSSPATVTTSCNDIANLYHDIDYNMSYDDLLDWISTSETVKSMLMAIEAVWTWSFYKCYYLGDGTEINYSNLGLDLALLQNKRGWEFLPYSFLNVQVDLALSDIDGDEDNNIFNCDEFCQPPHETSSSVLIDCTETCSSPLTLLSEDARLTFHFKPPSLSHCDLPGECGFILKAIPRYVGRINRLTLCVEKEDYNESVHFHEEFKAENMHLFFDSKEGEESYLYSLSWLGSLIDSEVDFFEQKKHFYKFGIDILFRRNSRFKILYYHD